MSNEKPEPGLSGPAKWAAAKTLAELGDAIEEIDVEVADAEKRKIALEADVGEFVLGGGDIGARSRDAYELGQKIVAFKRARSIIASRLSKAEDVEREREWADRQAAARAKAEWLDVGWSQFYGACADVIAASNLIAEIVGEIDAIEAPMARAGWKPGQLVHLLQVRALAAEKLPKLRHGIYETRRYDADAIEVVAQVASDVALSRGVHRGAHDAARAERNGTHAEVEALAKIGFDGRSAA